MAGLERFVEAQDAGQEFETALKEIRAGRKHGHWIWYVFPQLSGLGVSSMSQAYAIPDGDEAADYLRDPVLYPRLRTMTEAVAVQLARGIRVDRLMGSVVDARKLVSSLTLFSRVAGALHAEDNARGYDAFAGTAESILATAESQGFPACEHTLVSLEERWRRGR